MKNDLLLPEDFKKTANDFYSKMFAKIYSRYQYLLAENNAVDFDDLLLKTALLLRDYPEIRQQLSDRFKYLLVDEYQDTNHAQYQIAKGLALSHRNICVTGDPDQSIYRWRGADIKNILAFEKDWADAKIVKLEENFRSSRQILALADKLIANNKQRKEKRLVPTLSQSRDIECNVYEDERDESEAIAEKIKELLNEGADPNEIAILYRTNSMSRSIEEVFIRRNVPYIIVRGVEFYNRKEIRDMVAYLKLICNHTDNIAFGLQMFAASKRINLLEAARLAGNVDALSQNAAARIKTFAAMIDGFTAKSTAGVPVSRLLTEVYEKSGMGAALISSKDEQENAMKNIEELINSAAEYEKAAEEPSLFDYLQTISLYSDSDAYDPESGKVSLMTLHAAKGLEFENAFVVGLEEGILPHERSAENDKELEEERRLFFVGITRAKMGLYISRVLNRTIRGQTSRSMPSKFLYEAGLMEGDYQKPLPELNNGYSRFATGGAGFGRVYGNKQTAEKYKSRRKSPMRYDSEHIVKPAKSSQFEGIGRLPKTNQPPFCVGDKVRHPKLGDGIIKEYLYLGENSVITIRFTTGQTKAFIQKSVILEKIDR